MNLSNLKPEQGSIHTSKKRVGRGQGSGKGGTATRGHKGAKSRSGYSRKLGFAAVLLLCVDRNRGCGLRPQLDSPGQTLSNSYHVFVFSYSMLRCRFCPLRWRALSRCPWRRYLRMGCAYTFVKWQSDTAIMALIASLNRTKIGLISR